MRYGDARSYFRVNYTFISDYVMYMTVRATRNEQYIISVSQLKYKA